MTFAPNALLNCTSKLGVRRNFSNTDPQSPQDKDLFCYDQEGVGYPLPLRKGTMKESHPPFLPPISIVQALLHKTSVQLGPCLCSGWSFPALELTAGDEKKLDDVAADLALWRSPDAPRSVIAVLDSFPAQVLLMAGHSRVSTSLSSYLRFLRFISSWSVCSEKMHGSYSFYLNIYQS